MLLILVLHKNNKIRKSFRHFIFGHNFGNFWEGSFRRSAVWAKTTKSAYFLVSFDIHFVFRTFQRNVLRFTICYHQIKCDCWVLSVLWSFFCFFTETQILPASWLPCFALSERFIMSRTFHPNMHLITV